MIIRPFVFSVWMTRSHRRGRDASYPTPPHRSRRAVFPHRAPRWDALPHSQMSGRRLSPSGRVAWGLRPCLAGPCVLGRRRPTVTPCPTWTALPPAASSAGIQRPLDHQPPSFWAGGPPWCQASRRSPTFSALRSLPARPCRPRQPLRPLVLPLPVRGLPVRAHRRRLPGRAGGYPPGPPTDPDVRHARIRFLTQSCCCPRAVHWPSVIKVCALSVSPLSLASEGSARQRLPSRGSRGPQFPTFPGTLRRDDCHPGPLGSLRLALASRYLAYSRGLWSPSRARDPYAPG